MAQSQLEFTEETLHYFQQEGLTSVQWSPILHQISCQLDDKISLVVKKTDTSQYILLKKGTLQIKLSIKQFESLCDLKESIQLLKSFLDGQ